MIRVVLCGALGRMGRELAPAIVAADDLQLILKVDRERDADPAVAGGDVPLVNDLAAHFEACDLIVDFTAPAGTAAHARLAAAKRVPFVSGTTGLDADQNAAVRQASQQIPVLFASNMSLGITMAGELLRTAARDLPDGYDVEILEMHHGRKKDAPSGTALRLAEIVYQERRGLREVHALRGGDVVGEHQVVFAGPGERLIIKHVADSRRAFVVGTLAGIRFLIGRAPGLYSMADVLGARSSD